MPRKSVASRNRQLAKGVPLFGRSAMYRRKGIFAIKNRKPVAKKPEEKVVEKKFGKGGVRKIVRPRPSRFYPVDGETTPATRSKKPNPTRLRGSIKPGTVLILLAGRFRGKRVVFLKQLPSGLLLVTGPFKLNGVPLRRVNQAYVIATSTKVDLTGVNTDAFDDKYFQRAEKEKKKKTESEFFATETEKKKTLNPKRVEDQKVVDQKVLETVKKTPLLKQYLSSLFTLKKGQYPHAMKF